MRRILPFFLVLLFPIYLWSMGPKGGSASAISATQAYTASSFTVVNQLVVGSGTSKSTFTVTALALDDGLALQINNPLSGLKFVGSCNVTVDTPTVTRSLCMDSSFILYVGTQIVTSNWQKIGAQ